MLTTRDRSKVSVELSASVLLVDFQRVRVYQAGLQAHGAITGTMERNTEGMTQVLFMVLRSVREMLLAAVSTFTPGRFSSPKMERT